jgi:hypothetical protein
MKIQVRFPEEFVAGTDDERVRFYVEIAKDSVVSTDSFASRNPALVTGFFFFAWYVWHTRTMKLVVLLSSSILAIGHQYCVSRTSD